METLREFDLMGPHRGMLVRITELHGVMGQYEYKIEREPFWMEITPEHVAIAKSRLEKLSHPLRG